MKYRNLGRSSIKVSAISLGAWLTFGGTEDIEVTRACIQTAVEHGVNFFDLADSYAGGEAERVVGQALRDLGVARQHLVLSSKVFWPMSDDVNDRGLSRKHILESVEGSLRRLGVEYLDLYFCHRFDAATPLDEVVRAMDDLVHQGKILYWGTSVWTAVQLEAAVGTATRFNAYLPQVEQPRYNMLDRHIEPEILPTAARHGMGVVVFSPLAQGLLTGKYNAGIPEGSRAASSRWLERDLTEANLEKIRRLSALAEHLGLTVAQLALAWILRRPEISSAITGATKPQHVASNVAAADMQLSEDVLVEIEGILDNAPARG
ncbi:MAG TPA: aldo/keto reductase family protein [Anaerolineae bacterium]|mgnify:FL=1|nr:aldo/keto reductase family protein [Anaerolineae bacterium]HUM36750.1 aldo/keto reductase family protein [Anaerolineae bacterium]